jgi:uncharacterized membrane protein YkoI
MRKVLLFVSTIVLFSVGFVPVAELAHASQLVSGAEMMNGRIPEEKAKGIALNAVKGQSKAILHVHLETDDGHQYYEILVKADNMSYEVEIDAQTGNVLEIEKEHGHDNYGPSED